MQMQDEETIQATSPVHKNRRAPWLTGLGILIIVTLLAGLGATVFAYSRASHKGKTAVQSSTWQRVLDGYNIVSLLVAPSNPAVLYTCGTPLQASTPVPYRPSQPTISNTLLGSVDGGTIWQRLTTISTDCQIAINPAKSNDLYVVGLAGHLASNGQAPTVLRHSTDGGHSWTDIVPTFTTGNTQLSITWHVQQLSMVGNRLFGIQMLPSGRLQPLGQPSPVTVVTRLDLSRLVESSDGGHTWTILDSNLDPAGQAAHTYAVSPSDSQTVYELVGLQWPSYRIPTAPNDTPTYGSENTLTLYKTTNDGGTWTKLRENVPYNSKVQLANNTPSLVYVGGQTSTQPIAGQDIAPLPSSFLLAISKDGGATWQSITTPAQEELVQNWLVNADGQAYIATGLAPAEQPTVTRGTAIPGNTRQTQPVGTIVTSPQTGNGGVTAIQHYDAASGTWSTITKTPTSGGLIAVTASTTQHNTALWFLSDANNAQVLYRKIA